VSLPAEAAPETLGVSPTSRRPLDPVVVAGVFPFLEAERDPLPPIPDLRGVLDRQRSIAWKLLQLHLADLGDAECLWRPTPRGLHVVESAGVWRADWPESESYTTGPPSIAWLTWHVGFWWSRVLSHSFGDATVGREDVTWPGTASAAKGWLVNLHDAWVARLGALEDDAFGSTALTRWPFSDRPFADLVGWLNLELMKNASEIGYCRFLYAARGIEERGPTTTGA